MDGGKGFVSTNFLLINIKREVVVRTLATFVGRLIYDLFLPLAM
jgi:hypothetical protein